MAHKIVFILMDGVADVALPQLNHQTPLEFAQTPMLDLCAKSGLNGLMDPVRPGVACGTDTAHLSLFGYDPEIYYRGRGGFEALGSGLDVQPGDLAFKSNFSCMDEDTGIVIKRRCDREFEIEGKELCRDLNGIMIPGYPEYSVSVKYATEHRCGVRIRGPALSDCVTGTDPLRDNLALLRSRPVDESASSRLTSQIINALSDALREKLRHHPINEERAKAGKDRANVILLRGAGSRLQAPTFEKVHNLRPVMIAPTAIVKGIGISLAICDVKGATGDYHTDIFAKGDAIVSAMKSEKYDFGFVHIKAIDDAGHDGNVETKVRFIEETDYMLSDLVPRLRKLANEMSTKYTLCVCGDHSTPVTYLDHSCEPVPFLVVNVQSVPRLEKRIAESHFPPSSKVHLHVPCEDDGDFPGSLPAPDSVTAYGERWACEGRLGRFPGREVMPILKSQCL